MKNLRNSLSQIIEALRDKPMSVDFLYAKSIPRWEWVRLAVGGGRVALLLPAIANPPNDSILLENLSVRFNIQCEIVVEGVARLESVVLVEILSPNPSIESTFLDVIGMLLLFCTEGDPNEIAAMVAELVALFRSLTSDPRAQALGIWGELFVISESVRPDLLVEAWHSKQLDRFDFSFNRTRLEVKTTIGLRQHSFSYEQLAPSAEIVVVVASVITAPSTSGISIEELLDSVLLRMESPASKRRAVRVVMESLGRNWLTSRSSRFDEELAKSSLRWYESSFIPRVFLPPPGVFEVRFTSDLQLVPSLSPAELSAFEEIGTVIFLQD